MTAAAARRAKPTTPARQRKPLALWESVLPTPGAPLKVDRDKGVIYGVKVLGRFSPNCHGVEGVSEGTEYTVAAMRAALPLYENVTVRIDHPNRRDAGKPQSSYSLFGKLRDCRLDGESVRADLHYLKPHELAESVLDDVERGLGVYGLSHQAAASKGSVRGGRYVVEEIGEVRSVDLVDRPATNLNLWESLEMPAAKTTFKKLLESRLPQYDAGKRARVKKLLSEMDDDYAGAEMAEPAEGDGDWKADLLAAVAKLVDSSDEADQKKVTSIMGLLKPAKAEETPVEEEESDDEEGDGKKKDDVKESLATLKAEKAARVLCESIDYRPTEAEVSALAEITSDKARKLTADKFKAAAGTPGRTGPRSRSGHALTESREAAAPKDHVEFASAILGD